MKELLFVNACPRDPAMSRTLMLYRTFITRWLEKNPDYVVHERDLSACDTPVLTAARAKERDMTFADGNQNSPLLERAQEFARADRVIIAAPVWDLSFPAVLKVYLEWASTMGITFLFTPDGHSIGQCKADKLLYITTSGGPLEGQTLGIDYIRGICKMWGIPDFRCVSAECTDVPGNPGVVSLNNSKKELADLAEVW